MAIDRLKKAENNKQIGVCSMLHLLPLLTSKSKLILLVVKVTFDALLWQWRLESFAKLTMLDDTAIIIIWVLYVAGSRKAYLIGPPD